MNSFKRFALSSVILACFSWYVDSVSAQKQDSILGSERLHLDIQIAEVGKPQEELDKFYERELKELEKKAAAAGKLGLVLEAREEAKQFREGKGKAPEASEHAELNRLRDIYHVRSRTLKEDEWRKSQRLLEGFLAKLKTAVVSYTKSNQIEEALKVKEEMEKVENQIQDLKMAPLVWGKTDREAANQLMKEYKRGSEPVYILRKMLTSRRWTRTTSTSLDKFNFHEDGRLSAGFNTNFIKYELEEGLVRIETRSGSVFPLKFTDDDPWTMVSHSKESQTVYTFVEIADSEETE